LLIAATLITALLTVVAAQQPAGDAENVVIERMALDLRPPDTYHVALQLQPVTSLKLVARVDGVIDSVSAEPGEKLSSQEEVLRFQPGVRQIELERAQAAFQLARLEQEAAGEGPPGELAAARLEVAKLDLRIAEQRLEDLTIRAPFDGTMTAVHVTEGQFVRAGDPLATLADLTRLAVCIPVSRNDVGVGDEIEIRVEDTTVTGEVAQMLPLQEVFDPLRDLFLAVSTARVIVDGAGLSAGQAVSSDMIPRQPVAEVPTAALRNTDDGRRKVQVVREEYVRDVMVQLHGQNGEDHIFVSGRFEPADELIVESSHALLEGTRIVPPAADGFDEAGVRRKPSVDDDD
jgi:multidrug efflux pump subunit AcrA (membrane-fusion protein)